MTEITQERDPWARVPFWLLSAANPTAVVVYAALARYANMPEGAIPSIHRVAGDLGMSYRTVQRAVNDLEEAGAVIVEHRFADGNEKQRLPSRYHLLTSQPDKSVTPPVTSDATPLDTSDVTLLSPVSNEVEEVSKKKELTTAGKPAPDNSDSFQAFWFLYPKKVNKEAAKRKWATTVRRVDPEAIIEGLRRYVDWINRTHKELQYVKGPDVWLNKGCWTDELEVESEEETQLPEWMR